VSQLGAPLFSREEANQSPLFSVEIKYAYTLFPFLCFLGMVLSAGIANYVLVVFALHGTFIIIMDPVCIKFRRFPEVVPQYL
jgi:hypothetical protein